MIIQFLFIIGAVHSFQYLPVHRSSGWSYSLHSSESIQGTDISVEDVIKLAETVPGKSPSKDDYGFVPKNTGYIMCSTCKTAYLADDVDLSSKRGLRLKCGICEKEWFQSNERMMKTDDVHYLQKMTDAKIQEIKKIIDEKNFPKYPRANKIGIFVGNLPYTYTEKEIGDLFAEYGVTNIALVRGTDGLSKGFAFVEVIIHSIIVGKLKIICTTEIVLQYGRR